MKTIYTDNTPLVKDKRLTFLSSDATSGSSSITSQSIVQFTTNQILVIGELGNEQTEIIKTSSVTPPSGTTITLNSNLVFNHPQDTKVTIVDWDQIEVSWSSTVTGSKSVLATISVQVDQLETIYNDTVESSGFYFVRFKESIGGTFSDYSDPIPYAGFPDNTPWSIKKRALDSVNQSIDGVVITNDFLNQALWEGRREYHNSPGKRPFRRKFNVSIGTVTAGIYRVLLPSDCEQPYTAENVYGVRIGTQPNTIYYDKKEFDVDYQGVAHGVLTQAYSVGNQDLYLDDVREFNNPGGAVSIEDQTISYSAVGISGGTLRISTQGTHSSPSGSDAWQGTNMSLPNNFTVFADSSTVTNLSTGSAYIYFSCPLSTLYANLDIFADYYRTIVAYTSDYNILDEPEYDIYVPYLAWRIKNRISKGSTGTDDKDYQLWQLLKANALGKEYLGTESKFKPEVDHLPIPQ